MKKYNGFGIVWDPDYDRPLVNFMEDGTCTTDDSRVITVLEGLGYKGEEVTPTKSLDKMNVDELKAYAAEKEIDLTGITSKADILAKIKEVEGGN